MSAPDELRGHSCLVTGGLRAARRLARRRAARRRGARHRPPARRDRPHRCSPAAGPRATVSRSSTATSPPTDSSPARSPSTRSHSVFHLAAQTLVPTANRSPRSTFETNIAGHVGAARGLPAPRRRAGDRRLLGQGLRPARRAALPRGAMRSSPATPTTSPRRRPICIARSYWHTWRLPVAVTRFANLYGGGDFNRFAAGPRGGDRRARRALTGGPLRRLARARFPLRRGCGRGVPGDLGRARRRRGPAARRSTPAAGGRTGCVDVVELICRARRHRRRARHPRRGHAGGRDRPPVGRRRRSSRGLTGWRPRVELARWARADDRVVSGPHGRSGSPRSGAGPTV